MYIALAAPRSSRNRNFSVSQNAIGNTICRKERFISRSENAAISFVDVRVGPRCVPDGANFLIWLFLTFLTERLERFIKPDKRMKSVASHGNWIIYKSIDPLGRH